VAEVRSRVGAIRRRRTAGAALALVLLAAAGLTLARLPGKPATLPAGVPAGPYFDDAGTPRSVAGYRGASYFPFSGPTTWSLPVRPFVERIVVVARCAERGDLTLADLTGPGSTPTLSCRVPVGDHYEGALLLDPGAPPEPAPRTAPSRPSASGPDRAAGGRSGCWSRSSPTGSARTTCAAASWTASPPLAAVGYR
jgi:hypothetical protein